MFNKCQQCWTKIVKDAQLDVLKYHSKYTAAT